MVDEQLRGRDIDDEAVLSAMAAVPRHEFVSASLSDLAYDDRPLPIGHGQTISQPYVVALMSQLADIEPGERVLEIGTGSGYQAAVLAELGADVASIEIVPALGHAAEAALARLGYTGVSVRIGDGYQGWADKAPFDAILLTAAPQEIPAPLLDQLADGGRLVAPVGGHEQELIVVTRSGVHFERRTVAPVRFVPMTGRAQAPD
jgi:protein-L-isoaspartate(D-aspartate) O-methyltransferase